MQVFDCHAPANQKWRYTTSRTLFSPGFSPSTLDIVGASLDSGADIQLFTTNNPLTANQRWNFKDVSIVGFGVSLPLGRRKRVHRARLLEPGVG
jgi:hypothetical protein